MYQHTYVWSYDIYTYIQYNEDQYIYVECYEDWYLYVWCTISGLSIGTIEFQ